jgi:threonyl-tRNA synthetase
VGEIEIIGNVQLFTTFQFEYTRSDTLITCKYIIFSMNGFDLVKKEAKQNVIAIIENDEFKDLSATVKSEVVGFVDKGSVDGLAIVRHSTAHLLACALQRLYPNVKFAIGPSVENGFYYDIDLDVKLSENDFAKIEAEMKKIVDEDIKFSRSEISRKEALDMFKDNEYKLELINAISDDAPISVYYLEGFYDLCRGPHVPSTRYLKNFKLTKLAGAY